MERIFDKVFSDGVEIQDKSDIRIYACVISSRKGAFGLRLVRCDNVVIEDCRIIGVGSERGVDIDPKKFEGRYTFANLEAIGLHLVDCRNVIIRRNEILDVFGQGIVVGGTSTESTGDIAIEENRIAYIYDDGIKFKVMGDQEPPGEQTRPFRGGVVRKNMIHDIGLGITRLPFARHGMYLKVVDILVEENTVYNCFYGSGISLRNSGTVRNNRVWNCVYACIAYHSQTITTGGSRKVVVERNECRQDFGFDPPMRHVYDPGKEPNPCVQGAIFIGLEDIVSDIRPLALLRSSPLFIESVAVVDNTCTVYRDYPGRVHERSIPILGIVGENQDIAVLVQGNTLVDQRAEKNHLASDFYSHAGRNILA